MSFLSGREVISNITMREEISKHMAKLDIDGVDGCFHSSLRYFARTYLRRGGNLHYLKNVLGHSDIKQLTLISMTLTHCNHYIKRCRSCTCETMFRSCLAYVRLRGIMALSHILFVGY